MIVTNSALVIEAGEKGYHSRQAKKGNKIPSEIKAASDATQTAVVLANNAPPAPAIQKNPAHSESEHLASNPNTHERDYLDRAQRRTVQGQTEHVYAERLATVPSTAERGNLDRARTMQSNRTLRDNVPRPVRAPRPDHLTHTLDRQIASGFPPILDAYPVSKVSEELNARIVEVKATMESTARMERCLRALRSAAYNLGPDWDVKPFGSCANGFSTSSSDLDVTLMARAFGYDAAEVLGDWFLRIIMQIGVFSVDHLILESRIPLLKLRFEESLAVDVSFNNPMPLLNTRLLAAYSFADPRIQNLGVVVKIWAKGVGVCDASQSNLSSYSFTLMVLYFLQVHSEVYLPPVPVNEITMDTDPFPIDMVNFVSARWRCNLSLADLLEKFFKFYAADFSWGHEVVSVRCAARLSVNDSAFGTLRGRQYTRLHIEDPFQLERNLHCVLGMSEERQLRQALGNAYAQISAGQTPSPLIAVQRIPQSTDASRGLNHRPDPIMRARQLKMDARNFTAWQSTTSSDAQQAASDSSIDNEIQVGTLHR